jgi:basic membrane protein A
MKMKKILALVLSLSVVAALCFGLTACNKDDDSADLKVGVILVGDETEGYTKAHMNGIDAAVEALKADGKTVEVTYKKKVGESAECSTAAEELIAAGCTLIISNSYGHQDYVTSVAKTHSDITFIAMTGDYAAISGLSNLKNAFTDIYQARYVSGVVAGMKLQELVAAGKLTSANYEGGNIKIGYVGAYSYAEVVSGYTAFYLGVKSVVSNVIMDVQYTKSWFDFDKEYETAKALIADGCVIIGQHADSEGAPTACQEAYDSGKIVYSVGYNVDMLTAAPKAALTSATNNWEVYYEYAFRTALDGGTIATDWAKGYSDGAVAITSLGTSCAEGTQAKVDDVIAKIKDGTLKVFDCSTFTVDTSATEAAYQTAPTYTDGAISAINVNLSYFDYSQTPAVEVYHSEIKDAMVTSGDTKYFSESTLRSAPYFALRINGITELTREVQ